MPKVKSRSKETTCPWDGCSSKDIVDLGGVRTMMDCSGVDCNTINSAHFCQGCQRFFGSSYYFHELTEKEVKEVYPKILKKVLEKEARMEEMRT